MPTDTSLLPPRWDLSDLYSDPTDPRIEETLKEAEEAAHSFAARYRGKIATLSSEELASALKEGEALQERTALPGTYASLRFAADTSAEAGAFLQKVRERTTAAAMPLLFFDVELTALGADRIRSLAEEPALSDFRHYLTTVAARAEFRLSEPEERVLEEQANTGRRAFVRLYEEITASLRFSVEGHAEERSLTLSEALDLQHDPDRDVRRASAEAVTRGLEPHARTLAFVFNTLIQDKATDDRLRGHSYPEEARHLANELSPATVETVVDTAVEGFPLVARYYEAKRRLLGLPELTHYDRYAPISKEEVKIPYGEARDLILAAFAEFDARYADAAQRFFDGGWIDAEARPGKRGGAFCSYVTPDRHPYIFLNYLGKQGDVRTLAHELGHGIHSYLSRGQHYFNYHGTLPMAEVASTFAEQLVFERQRAGRADTALLSLYAEQIEQAIATIFRQAAMYRFEQAIHWERREKGELSVTRFGELWQENLEAMFQGSVTLQPGHALWWTYVRHFVATPFYVYAYTFGEMLALALYARYRQEGKGAFAPLYLQMLSHGGSLTPKELVSPLGVDLEDRAFWRGALGVLEEQVKAFEELAEQVRSATNR